MDKREFSPRPILKIGNIYFSHGTFHFDISGKNAWLLIELLNHLEDKYEVTLK